MHILIVADGRSPTTRRWVQGLLALKQQVTLISTYPCAEIPGTEHTHILPVAFGGFSGSQVGTGQPGTGGRTAARRFVGKFRNLLTGIRYGLGPWMLEFSRQRYQKLVRAANPDLVHAMRIPFEGMLSAFTPREFPLVISIWGNDLTLHARRSGRMRALTRRALKRADGLLADTRRDIRLAFQWGFLEDKPTAVLPGGGGVDLEEVARLRAMADALPVALPADAPLVVNPRGFRPGSVRNDTFFQAIPLVLERLPDVFFICPGMAGQPEAVRWVEKYHLDERVRLLPFLTQAQLWGLFQRAAVSVSVSQHDGTPNTLLEAMACGCFPVAGDIDSLREWITPGINGLLVQPDQAQQLAEALVIALQDQGLRQRAAALNTALVADRASAPAVRQAAVDFYQRVAARSQSEGTPDSAAVEAPQPPEPTAL